MDNARLGSFFYPLHMHALKQDLSFSAVVAGCVAVLVSFTGSLIIVLQAAHAAHLPPDIVASWIWAISIGSGVTGVLLSWRTRTPVITAWSTPGAALLVGLLPTVSINEAVGAYFVSAALVAAIGLSGAFDKLIGKLPKPLAAAMLAGILFHFGAEVFVSIKPEPLLVIAMFATYLICKRASPRYAIVAVLLVGTAIAASLRMLNLQTVVVGVAKPVFITPAWHWHAIVNLALPLALVALTGQNVPGMAVMRTSGYQTPARPIVSVTAIASMVLAPFGSHGVNLAAITAAICTNSEAHEDKNKRYVAGIVAGCAYIVVGTFGSTLASVFGALPKTLVGSLAGLALFGAIANGLSSAMSEEKDREAALITFLVTASGMTFLGFASAFWGLIFGLAAHATLHAFKKRQVKMAPSASS